MTCYFKIAVLFLKEGSYWGKSVKKYSYINAEIYQEKL